MMGQQAVGLRAKALRTPDGKPGFGGPGLNAVWRRYGAITVIMLVAIALRVAWPGRAEFKIDEVQPLVVAEQIWLDHRLPLIRGTTSIGLPGTPFLGYLLALPRAVSADPQVAVAFVGLLGALAVLATYVAVRRYADERLALVAAGLYAASPWAVMLTRKTWSHVLPLFTVVILWAAYGVVVGRRPAWAVAFFGLLALQVQTHVVAVLYLPAVLLTALAFWPRWRHRYTLAGLALGLLILSPYLWTLVRQWPATLATVQRSGQGLTVDSRAVLFALWLASGRTVTALMGQSVAALRPWEEGLRAVNLLTLAVLALGLGQATWMAVHRRVGHERGVLLLIWLVTPVVPQVLMPGEIGIHYLQLIIPALFVAAALGWSQMLAVRKRLVAYGAAVALFAILTVQVGTVLALYHGLAHHPTGGGFGRPLSFWWEVQRGVLARAHAEGWGELLVFGTNDAPWHSERAVLDYLLGRRMRLRYVGQGGRPGLLLPIRDDALALVLSADETMEEALGRFGGEVERWEALDSEWGVRLYRLKARGEAEVARDLTVRAPATLDNGMRLLGARLPRTVRPGTVMRASTYWTFTGRVLSPGTTDTAFSHLVDGSGRRWAQNDGFALSQPEWVPGYTLIQWFELVLPSDLPPGDYELFTGMYSWRDMSVARVVDEAGRPVNDGVRLGPIRVQ